MRFHWHKSTKSCSLYCDNKSHGHKKEHDFLIRKKKELEISCSPLFPAHKFTFTAKYCSSEVIRLNTNYFRHIRSLGIFNELSNHWEITCHALAIFKLVSEELNIDLTQTPAPNFTLTPGEIQHTSVRDALWATSQWRVCQTSTQNEKCVKSFKNDLNIVLMLSAEADAYGLERMNNPHITRLLLSVMWKTGTRYLSSFEMLRYSYACVGGRTAGTPASMINTQLSVLQMTLTFLFPFQFVL